jgi:predicted Zn-dependent protease
MIGTLKKLQKGQWFGTNTIPQYLLTHPGGPERISNTEVLLADYEPGSENKWTATFRRLFPFFKAVVIAKCLDPVNAEKLLNEELERKPHSASTHFGLGIVFKERWDYSGAVAHFREALEIEPKSVPVLVNLGEAYQLMGRNEEAIAVLQKALAIENRNRAALFLLANTYQSLEEYEDAIRLYTRLTLMGPVKNEVFYNLGVSYGRINKLGYAHYNLGVYFKRQGTAEKAQFHFQKADDHAGYDQALRRRIQKATGTYPQE